MGVFLRRSRAANSVVGGPIWPKFELIHNIMHVLGNFFRRSRAANSVIRERIRPNFELMQALMYIIVTCKYKKDPIKKQPRKRDDALFPIITLWELSVAMETRVLI